MQENKYYMIKDKCYSREFTDSNDGVTHINVYSRGKTELGRLLSNFAHTPFTLDKFRDFASVEGFWYWYFSDSGNNDLRKLHGFQAKILGQRLMKGKIPDILEIDKQVIICAIHSKLDQNPYIVEMLVQNDLPLAHYYVNSENGSIIYKDEYIWITDAIERYRQEEIKKLILKKLNDGRIR